ncbi:hypothetical protein [Streptomyces qinglanensis]|uniref:hypothetical protein n=1 Tax=Streptomyces qinglanensis TaxID=943816 RepID=UPI003D73E599
MTGGQDTPIGLLEVVATRLRQYWAGIEAAVPGTWTGAPLVGRAELLTQLAWQARDAHNAHPATHPASRLALATAREAQVWEQSLTSGGDIRFRLGSHWLEDHQPATHLEACVRLLSAIRTGVLPAAPERCAICRTERDLRLVFQAQCSGPGLQEWRCPQCGPGQ